MPSNAIRMFTCSYIDRPLFHLDEVVDQAVQDLAGVDFDTIVGTGMSGALVIPYLALRMDKMFTLIRKEGEQSHHAGGAPIGSIGERWLFVDDFVSTGSTRSRVVRAVDKAMSDKWYGFPEMTTLVGQYMYNAGKYDGEIWIKRWGVYRPRSEMPTDLHRVRH